MADWNALYCANHPERFALERCEVCGKPLCAYCLYYTEDGQRLCVLHAEEARDAGLTVEEPAIYSGQLIGAQAGADRKRKREQAQALDGLYVGNSNDLVALLGLVVGVVSLGACCGIGYCFPFVGVVLSLVAIVNGGRAHDPRRTRRLGWLGLLISGIWIAVIALCIVSYGFSLREITTWSTIQNWPVNATATPAPSPTPSVTALPDGDASSAQDAAEVGAAAVWR